MKSESGIIKRPSRAMVKPRVQSGPVNRSLVLAGGFAAMAWLAWPNAGSDGLRDFYAGLGAVCAAACGARGGTLLVRDYRHRRDLAIAHTASTDHGSARQSTRDERIARGMGSHVHGEFYGLDDEGQPVFRPAGAPFALIEMPPGVGKTVCLVIGSILHRARLGFPVVAPDEPPRVCRRLFGLSQAAMGSWSTIA